jgi:SRSO17 transposase
MSVTTQQIIAVGSALQEFLQPLFFCCGDTRTFAHLLTYCHGLLSPLPRKSVEPIALAAGTPVRSLQLFLTQHQWSTDRLRRYLYQQIVTQLRALADTGLGTIGMIDETAVAKKGQHTPAVQRQWCNELGKTDNCIVTVHLALARGRYKTLADTDLYLPKVWHLDRRRCRAAGIPDSVVYRPKWQIALEQLQRAFDHGLRLDWLTFDEGYGSKPGFLAALERYPELGYVGEVPKSFACFTAPPRSATQSGHRADQLVRHSPVFYAQAWQNVRLPRQTLAPQQWQVKQGQVWVRAGRGTDARPAWLLAAQQEQTGEVKYLVARGDGCQDTERLLRVAFWRWAVEHGFRVSKSELGFRDYEGRDYTGLLRHLLLCVTVLVFVSGQAAALRGEKPRNHGGTGVRGAAGALRGVVGRPAGNVEVGIHGHDSPVSSAA